MSVWQDYRDLEDSVTTTCGHGITALAELREHVMALKPLTSAQLESTLSQLSAIKACFASSLSRLREIETHATHSVHSQPHLPL